MIQSTYTQVSNADIVSCGKKGETIKSDPIPLLRNNYLGEYRTALEKAKVRQNLDIPDLVVQKWGNLTGFIEEQTDLMNYINRLIEYKHELSEDITTVKQALDYALHFVSTYKTNDEAVKALNQEVITIKELINSTEEKLQSDIDINTANIEDISEEVIKINDAIIQINNSIETIDVDKNIANWIQKSLENSTSIELVNNTLQIKISPDEKNAVDVSNGLFIKDFSNEVETLIEEQETIKSKVQEHTSQLSTIDVYNTDLSDDTTAPNTVGGVSLGTKVSELKGKTITEIIDYVLFPTTVRDLIYPSLYYEPVPYIVEVGTANNNPEAFFTTGDSGGEISREVKFSFNGSEIEKSNYSQLGTYTHTTIVQYSAGEYLIDNKGQVTTKRIEAGEISASTSVTTTYPWFAGNTVNSPKQSLIKFGQSSGDITLALSGKAVIKLPGSNTTLNLFQVDGGMGFLNIDLSGWTQTEETINGYPYKVWTKNDEYNEVLTHKINFTLNGV